MRDGQLQTADVVIQEPGPSRPRQLANGHPIDQFPHQVGVNWLKRLARDPVTHWKKMVTRARFERATPSFGGRNENRNNKALFNA